MKTFKNTFKTALVITLALSLILPLFACKEKTSGSGSGSASGNSLYQQYFDVFDTVVTLSANGYQTEEFEAACQDLHKEMQRYHHLLDIYHTYDGVTNLKSINDAAAEGSANHIKVDPELMHFLKESKKIYNITSGATNIALGSVIDLWHRERIAALDHPDKAKLPDEASLKAAGKHINIDDLVLDTENNEVSVKDRNLRLDGGAIAKGYIADRLADYAISKHYNHFLLNIGGNIKAVGSKDAAGTPWSVAIQNPEKEAPNPYLLVLNLVDTTLVTSGIYERFYIFHGKCYHHIIDPATLFPSDRFKSVSVFTHSSTLADGLTTGLFNMDLAAGQSLVAKLDDVEAVWVDHNGKVTYSPGLKKYIKTSYVD